MWVIGHSGKAWAGFWDIWSPMNFRSLMTPSAYNLSPKDKMTLKTMSVYHIGTLEGYGIWLQVYGSFGP